MPRRERICEPCSRAEITGLGVDTEPRGLVHRSAMTRQTWLPLVLGLAALAVGLGAWLAASKSDGGVSGGASEALEPEPLAPTPPGPDAAPAARLEPGPVRQGASEPERAAAPERPDLAPTPLVVRALDGTTGAPVAAFFVTVLPEGVHAQGRRGTAELRGLAAGDVTLQVEGPEHGPAVALVSLPTDRTVEVRLPQRPGLRGTVRFADARPAADVSLRLEPPPPPGAAPYVTLAKTDAEGRFRFAPLPEGEYTLKLEHLSLPPVPLGPFSVKQGLCDVPEVYLEAGARLELFVSDAQGAARPSALIVIAPAEGTALRRYTGPDGDVTLEPLAPGRYTINLPAQDGAPEQSREVELTLGLRRESFVLGGTQEDGR